MNTYIRVIDDLPPEAVAMLQALYSRDPRSVNVHLDDVRARGAAKFMARYYVGYGHKSIGDCGTTTVFVENVSLLAAKALQDHPLYNGQESSTRYLDFARMGSVNPIDLESPALRSVVGDLQGAWLILYEEVKASLRPHFEQRFPRKEGEKEETWSKAIDARVFDVARGFLPAGACTMLSWHTNLRQAADKLMLLRFHQLAELRQVAVELWEQLALRYPSSFGHRITDEQASYLTASAAEWDFTDRQPTVGHGDVHYENNLKLADLAPFTNLLSSRPPRTELHQRFRQFGSITFDFLLDFGSYRDFQRHRSCPQEMPLLTTRHGFFPWYLEQLPDALRATVEHQVEMLGERIELLPISPEEKQYCTAIGYTCAVHADCSLPSAVYIAELRSGVTVHPTVRAVAQRMGEILRREVPGLALHCDWSEDAWSIKRGKQDIIDKEAV